ncbi:MAG: phenylacetate-CoA oxygenase subunit PaaJ [Emcibacter sp.]|nr:phenylacetate-CoA oxygenase subunit PaaJ [Emcibacter sp.]
MASLDKNFDPARVWSLLEEVKDPEIPVLSIVDLGIAREVNKSEDGQLEIVISPTYSGCPAMYMLEDQIKDTLSRHGFMDPIVTTQLSPAWTTDWMTESGRIKLEAYGIAPPEKTTRNKTVLFGGQKKISCPRCKSDNSEQISEFGSTACKALYRCLDCLEPFDYFKCI